MSKTPESLDFDAEEPSNRPDAVPPTGDSQNVPPSSAPDSSTVLPPDAPIPIVLPPIIVDDDDFDETDVVFRTLPKIDVGPASERGKSRKARKTRKIFGVFAVPRRWRNLTTAQVLWRAFRSKRNLGASISFAAHLALVLILASIVFQRVGTLGDPTTVGFSPEAAELERVEEIGDALDAETTFEVVPDVRELPDFDADVVEERLETETNAAVAETLLETSGSDAPRLSDVGEVAPATPGGGVPFYDAKGSTSGRTKQNRKRGLPGREGDVTDESEDAVERGLEWLARHQLPDGGWSFELTAPDSNGRKGACRGCSNTTATSGGGNYLRSLHPSRTAATALALLPFLGAGYTHVDDNKYRETIGAGLTFLKYRAVRTEYGYDYREEVARAQGTYVQSLVVLALCEAFETSGDADLRVYAEKGLDFIAASQLDDGGWRYYSPGDFEFRSTLGGDSSALGWAAMALKAGASAGFELEPRIAYRIGGFLDSVMAKDGRSYRYQTTTDEPVEKTWGTTAVGVLVREYLGWAPGTKKLDAGADQLGKWIDENQSDWQKVKKGAKVKKPTVYRGNDGRIVYNLYFAYYAALALHHYGGKDWSRRFPKLREFLIETQARGLSSGCEDGSWIFDDQYLNDGGRLVYTALAVLVLETPYRYLPIYR